MARIAIWTIMSLLVWAVGCGDDSPAGPDEPVQELPKGLSGDTYFNTKFGVSITGLPVDDWTVKALGKDGQGMLLGTTEGFINLYSLLLMEPVSAEQFVGPGEGGYLDPVYEAEIPFIWLGCSYEKGLDVETHQLAERLDQYAVTWSYELESKKAIHVGKWSGIQGIILGDDWKEALTWFAKGEQCIRFEYAAPASEFDKYFGVYEQVLEKIWLLGK
jgi:hypothetical protein